ncbi:hypothetical protein ACQPZZ_10495 [Microbispora sp. CA-135349]|uniref:hypothetical protein n=1 Tax=Microbispora sp. CA-135349 TaxID=3239953 RepID=UPI003D8DEFFD
MRTLRLTFLNARLCGYRELRGELVRDANGDPVIGEWQPILTPDEWLAVREIIHARRGHSVKRGGAVGTPYPHDFREHRYLLTGILRCGRPIEGGGLCNAILRTKRTKDGERHMYFCPGKAAGGCGGIGRRGDLVDFAISELVLEQMKLVQYVDAEDAPEWTREQELKDLEGQLTELTSRWRAREISNNLYFGLVSELEGDIARLRAEKSKILGRAERKRASMEIDMSEIRPALVSAGRGGRATALTEARARPRDATRGDRPSGGQRPGTVQPGSARTGVGGVKTSWTS